MACRMLRCRYDHTFSSHTGAVCASRQGDQPPDVGDLVARMFRWQCSTAQKQCSVNQRPPLYGFLWGEDACQPARYGRSMASELSHMQGYVASMSYASTARTLQGWTYHMVCMEEGAGSGSDEGRRDVAHRAITHAVCASRMVPVHHGGAQVTKALLARQLLQPVAALKTQLGGARPAWGATLRTGSGGGKSR